MKKTAAILVLAVLLAAFTGVVFKQSVFAAEENGSVGLEGKISSAPPAVGASITLPRDGTTTTTLPITVSGICPTGLLVKIFKNNVFAGSTQCNNGSFSLQIDLFSGRNELVARVYDDLDQAGPDSNMVVVNFPFTGTSAGAQNRISLTTNFAKRGANPGQNLVWPITLSGGIGPYAITVDWGDGKPADVISRQFAGNFDISHVYESSGIYNVVIRATDSNGNLAFLQVVGIANGPISQNLSDASKSDAAAKVKTKILWQPAAITLPLLFTSFWLGKKYGIFVLRRKLERLK